MSNALRVMGAVVVACGVVGGAGCARDQAGAGNEGKAAGRGGETDSVALLEGWLSGSFSSAGQAAGDAAYFDIRLHVAPIWPERSDGPWLYVEQARADALDRPYRQRVYRLSKVGGDLYRSDVYTLPDPATRFVGAWKTGEGLKDLTPEDLELREGCSIVLTWVEGERAFMGSTDGRGCGSSLQGASYATSEVVLRADGMASWDRGYDAAGKQVWGAEKGGYVFLREAGGGMGGRGG